MPSTASTVRTTACLVACALLTAPGLFGRQRNEGADITGSVSDRDNTRVLGTVYDHEGNTLTNVNIWVINDDAPARRQRTKTRKTGSYLARNLSPLLEDFNLEGINLRLVFEKDGYRSVETTIGVRRNSMGAVYPILWPNGVDPEPDGVYALLSGQILGPDGKPAKGASLTIGSPDSDLAVEAAVEKKGEYEALVWGAPRILRLDVTAPGQSDWSQEITLSEQPRPDLLQVANFDIELEG